ncbi:Uncharacterized ABC transporter ATP-binding protein MJ1242 [Listeria monocytogenes]|nr:Uncharacterized ABC transporter ATP-binding protein MJ1242 [Listeria monocytogenes]
MLEIKNLSKKFDQKTILDNVNISLQDGLLVHQVVGKQLYFAVLVDWKKWMRKYNWCCFPRIPLVSENKES